MLTCVLHAPLELVLQSFGELGALSPRVHLVKGLFESSVPAFGRALRSKYLVADRVL